MLPRSLWVLALAAIACARGAGGAAEIPDPDLRGLEPQVQEAIARSREALVQDPASPEAWGELASVFDAHLLAEAAEVCYRRAHELAPEDFRWTYLWAVVREIDGAGADELIDLFGQAAKARPDYAPTHLRLGDALWRRGRQEEAVAELERAIELQPDAALAHRRLGQVRLGQGNAAQARAALERAVLLEPRDLAARTALAQAYARLGESARAREVLAGAAGLEPVNTIDDPVHAEQVMARNVGSEHLFGEGVHWIELGRPEDAIVPLAAAAAAAPGHPSAHYWLGVAYRRSGKAQDALTHLTRAVEIEPRLNAARLELAELLAEAGRSAEAAEHYRQALRYAPNDPEIHAGLARLGER